MKKPPRTGARFPVDGVVHLADIRDAFIYGAREARANPDAPSDVVERAADAYVKLVLSKLATRDFAADLSGRIDRRLSGY